MNEKDIRLEDRIEFALRDAGFDPDSAFEYARRAAMAPIEVSETNLVTHADYRALEEDRDSWRTKYDASQEAMTETQTELVRVVEELAALRGKVGELVIAAKDMSNVLTQAMLNKPIPVHRYANAIQRTESALEALS